mgnify:CR=1 FL=1
MINNLSIIQKKIIHDFTNQGLPLFIFGKPGIGKTTLANELLKDTIMLKIDTNDLKKHKDIGYYISNSLGKKNITLMFQKSIPKRSLLIDDFDIFYKNDKSSYKSILNFLTTTSHLDCKIIITMHINFRNNRSLKKINYQDFILDYSPPIFYKIVKNILKSHNIQLQQDDIDKAIHDCKMNLNTLLYNIKMYQNKLIIQNDDFDSVKTITDNILKYKYSMGDILRLCEYDESVIGLNLLENIYKICPIHKLPYLYQMYVFSDIIDTFTMSTHLWEFRQYSILFSIYSIHINTQKQCKIIYNKYISKSLIQTHSNKLYYKYKNHYHNCIYLYLYMIDIYNDKTYEKYITNMDKKQLTFYQKSFHYFYR